MHFITIENPVIDLNEKHVLEMYSFPWKRPLFLYAHEKDISASPLPGYGPRLGELALTTGEFTNAAGEFDVLLVSFFFVGTG